MRKGLLLISLLILVVLGAGLFFMSESQAEGDDCFYKLGGTAWTAQQRPSTPGSPVGVGWIKFSSDPVNGSEPSFYDYGVCIDSKGNFSGHAWAGPYYGWLNFEDVEMNMETGELNGQARFKDATGHWDGRVHLSGSPYASGEYGVKMDLETLEFSGHAWGGGTVVGWIDFDGVTANGDSTTDKFVCDSQGENKIYLSWELEGELSNYSFQLWGGKAGYDLIEIFEVISGGQEGNYTHTGLSPGTEYNYELRIFDEGEEKPLFEPAPITCKTESPPGPYSLNCQTKSKDEIRLYWLGEDLPDYKLQLWSKEASGDFENIGSFFSGDGSFDHTELLPDTEYNYELRIFDEEEDREESLEPQPAICTTADNIPNPPDGGGEILLEGLEVWPKSYSELHLTWKDKLVVDHHFIVERIKLTPDDPTMSAVSSIESNKTGALSVSWKNETNISDKVISEAGTKAQRGPFYNLVLRKREDGSYKWITESGVADANSSKTSFSMTNNGLKEATAYEYKVMSCSYAKVDFTRDGTNNPQKICSGLSDIKGWATAPLMPDGLAENEEAKNRDSLTITWNDNSEGEDGYEVWRDNAWVKTITSQYPEQKETMEYTDEGLEANTEYTYKVRAFKNYGADKIYSSFSETVSATTDSFFEVLINIGLGGEVIVNPGDKVCHSSQSCRYYFLPGQLASFEAVPVTDYEFLEWVGGDTMCNFEEDGRKCVIEVTDEDEFISLRPRFKLSEDEGGSEPEPDKFRVVIETPEEATVYADPPQHHCNLDKTCTYDYDIGDAPYFHAYPSYGYRFDFWDGDVDKCELDEGGEKCTLREITESGSMKLEPRVSSESSTLRVEINVPDGGGVFVYDTSDILEFNEDNLLYESSESDSYYYYFNSGTDISFHAKPFADYDFVDWNKTEDVCYELKTHTNEDDVCVIRATEEDRIIKDLEPIFELKETGFNEPATIYAKVSSGLKNLGLRWPDINIGNFFNKSFEKIKKTFSSVEEKLLKTVINPIKALAGSINSVEDMEGYFGQFKKTIYVEANLGVYDDNNGLKPDTVYLYKVTAIVDDEESEETGYSVTGAGKTLPGTEGVEEEPVSKMIKLCTWNSRCEDVECEYFESGGGEFLKNQCQFNADCRDVGNSKISFKEE